MGQGDAAMKPDCDNCEVLTQVLQEAANVDFVLNEKLKYAMDTLTAIADYKSEDRLFFHSLLVVRDIASKAVTDLRNYEK